MFPSKFGHFQLPVSLDTSFQQYFFRFSNVLSFSFPSSTPVRDKPFVIVPQAPAALFIWSLPHRSWPMSVDGRHRTVPMLWSAPLQCYFPLVCPVLLGFPLTLPRLPEDTRRVPSSQKISGLKVGERIL